MTRPVSGTLTEPTSTGPHKPLLAVYADRGSSHFDILLAAMVTVVVLSGIGAAKGVSFGNFPGTGFEIITSRCVPRKLGIVQKAHARLQPSATFTYGETTWSGGSYRAALGNPWIFRQIAHEDLGHVAQMQVLGAGVAFSMPSLGAALILCAIAVFVWATFLRSSKKKARRRHIQT